ncbi:MAG: MGMT family protein [Spirochaetaceae bacterium]|jgi:methylated-DNA-protein-cysteine methyltransferase-like protein|nr:MGMT family protein [Spirochaetaceae bacterium]
MRIIEAIREVPPGKTASYRDIALAAGLPNGARQVARILHSMSRSERLPWHRIVKADGRIAFPPGELRDLQTALLRAEGIAVNDDGTIPRAPEEEA